MTAKEVVLKVQEALQEEAYKGVLRVDTQTMRLIDIKPGDVIEIEGGRKTVGLADRAYPSDIGQAIIRMDGIIRRNAKTGIGELVKVRKADFKEAKTIHIAPAQQGVMIQANPELFKQGLLGRAIVKGDLLSLGGTRRRRRTLSGSPFEDIFNVFEEGFMGNFGIGNIKFIAADSNPKGPVLITENTEVRVSAKAVEVLEERVPDVTYEDIGGLDEEIKKIREMVELPLRNPEIFERLGIEPPKGVLLHGVPGTGKTLLAKAVATECQANFISINGPEVISKYYGDSEKRIRQIFEEAEKNAPTIIFIDEIDSIAPKREEVYGEVERRVVSQILTCLDGMKKRGKVIILAATNRVNSLDPALRRPGRFDREIVIGVPNKQGRLKILKIHTRNMPIVKDVSLENIADITHGFVGADLEALCKEAAMNVLRRVLPDLKLKGEEQIPPEMLSKLSITTDDFKAALRLVRPSAMREVLIEAPNVHWDDIGGLEELKQSLKESVETPLKNPEAFKRLGIKPPKGILIYGPPGCGKTMIAKAVATESQANFIPVKGPELLNKFVGESERAVTKIFEKARQTAPSIIYFDEIDSLVPRRGMDLSSQVTERVVNAMLAEMDGLQELSEVVVIATTNRPDLLDPALLRPGRFDRAIATTLPNKKTRVEILKLHTTNMPVGKEVSFEKIADKTEGFTGADISAICKEAALAALRENIEAKEVGGKYFDIALQKVRPSLSPEEIKLYTEAEEKYVRKAKAAQAQLPPSYLG